MANRTVKMTNRTVKNERLLAGVLQVMRDHARRHGTPASFRTLAQQCGITEGYAYHCVRTLLQRGEVAEVATGGKYSTYWPVGVPTYAELAARLQELEHGQRRAA